MIPMLLIVCLYFFQFLKLNYFAGHSRTIIGLEELSDGNLQLLVFDPSHNKFQMEQFNSTSLNYNTMRLIRRPLSAVKARQYQLVYVDGILDSEDEYQVRITFDFTSKVIFIINIHWVKIGITISLLRITCDTLCNF